MTNVLVGILSALLILVFIVDFSMDLGRERHKVVSSVAIFVTCGVVIWYLDIEELDGQLAAFLVAGFLFFGSYVVYRLTTWLRNSRRRKLP